MRTLLCAALAAAFLLPLHAAKTEPPSPNNSTPTASAVVPPQAISSGTPVVPGAPMLTPPGSTSPGTPSASAAPVGTLLPEGSEPEKSVVQILNAFQEPNWSAPWIFEGVRYASGTGFLIDGNRIMTNAHVVAWNKQLLVRRYHDPQRYTARVEFVGHDVDLAVIKVDDPKFYEGMKPLDLGGLPKVRSTVLTYGFPAGGEQISYTRGVVSRIEVQGYVHIGNRAFLACQTDAAINPGNSGGPVIQDDKVAGVAFEGTTALENTGFFIPTTLIRHFLDDIKDGTYDGVPDSGLHLTSLQSPAFRRYLKLDPESKRGVRVDRLLDIPATRELMRTNDVVLQVGDFPVDQDGTITYEGNTVGASVAFDLAQNHDSIPLKIWREGKELNLKLPVTVYNDDNAQGNQYDVPPRYEIFGGMVFTTLSLDYLKSVSRGAASSAREMIYELYYRHLEDPKNWRFEPVVLVNTLDYSVNADLHTRDRALVDTINGQKINSLADVGKAFASGDGQKDVLVFLPDHHFEVIDHIAAKKANGTILDLYSVPAESRL